MSEIYRTEAEIRKKDPKGPSMYIQVLENIMKEQLISSLPSKRASTQCGKTAR